MGFAFQRRTSSPKSPEYLSDSGSPRMPAQWKRRTKRLLDTRRLLHILGVVFVFVIALSLLKAFFFSGTEEPEDFVTAPERHPNTNHFLDFEGDLECGLSSTHLYVPPTSEHPATRQKYPFCKNRAALLDAMSNGGRHGFNEPYFPQGCHYKWYSTTEICMIMDRFDGVVFVGDDLIAGIYGAFNMLLRRNIQHGALEQWRMGDRELNDCRCSRQYTNPQCGEFFVQLSEEVTHHDQQSETRSPFACNRSPHFYFPISGVANPDDTQRFNELLEQDPHSWKPVPIIHSLGLSTSFNWQVATESMDEWLTIADNSGRNTPFLWVGPNAAGHLKLPSKIMQEGNNALWHYSLNMAKEALRRGVESLQMYNLTLQATSWDGSSYDDRVALVQAMMVINWLARLETT